MNVTTALGIAAATFGVAMGLSPLLQLRRVVARGSSADVSVPYLGVLLIGFVLWLAYGVSIDNWALIVPNTIAAIVAGLTIAVARRYRRP